jgi:hypothetical protein
VTVDHHGILGGDCGEMDESEDLEADGDSSFRACMGVFFTGVLVDISLAIFCSGFSLPGRLAVRSAR